MLYAETAVASVIFNVSLSALKEATRRNSQKYPFIRITDAKVRSRGGVKLLFEVEVAQINSCIKSGKLDSDVGVYMLKDGEYSQIKFSEIVGKNSTKTSESERISYFNLSQSEQESVNEKLKILKEWDEYKRAGLSSKKFCKDFNISEARFFRWQRAYREQGAVGLADKRGKHRVGASKLSGWMMEFVLNKFRAYGAGAKLNITEVWKALHKEAGVREGYDYYGFLKGEVKPLFDTGAIKRYLDNYFANKPLELTMITKGMDKAKSYHQPAFGSQGEIITRRNQCWQIDSSPLDVMARDGKGGEAIRADILSIVDVYSGRCVASVESSSNALALVRLMWRALSTLGKPEFIKGDNGKDYLSRQFQYLLNGLGIGYDRAIAYSGDEKGFVERHFRTMQHSGMAQTPGYVGFNLAMREAIEQRTPKRERHAKDELGHTKKTNLKYLLTLDEMRARFETEVLKWDITAVKRKGLSPMQKWNSDDTPLKGVEYHEFLLYAGGRERRVVGKKGISFNAKEFGSDELPGVGIEVEIRENIDNVAELFVFDTDGKFICVARDKEIYPMSLESFKMSKKVFKEEMKEINRVIKNAELSEFTKLNVEYDLEQMKKAHKESLKAENFKESENVEARSIKEKIEEQKRTNAMKKVAFDYENYEVKTDKKSSKSVIDLAIENSLKAV
ncbi:DDE-type integrase/transposase/recombinase [Campylobacter sp. RM13119]|uniref:DDE-type integrase/transposase/recombinase n=1 Tax=Campylobacter californiensis TaxID=1032243 RepID=UPI00147446E4|nr:DDE-type integrase/transposase/recombinase [Campylobacter sp. RM13119]MBE3606113.1 DDE-type integrase/transposase/recombinase [Campylobacter sp. RM13119]